MFPHWHEVSALKVCVSSWIWTGQKESGVYHKMSYHSKVPSFEVIKVAKFKK